MSTQATSDEVHTNNSVTDQTTEQTVTAVAASTPRDAEPADVQATELTEDSAGSETVRIRMTRSSLMVVLFLAVCVTPLAISAPGFLALYAIPVLFAMWVFRAGVDAGPDGLTVRALISSRHLPWDQLAGLQVNRHGAVYALTADAKMRLPVVRVADLPRIAAASDGRIQLADNENAATTESAKAKAGAPETATAESESTHSN